MRSKKSFLHLPFIPVARRVIARQWGPFMAFAYASETHASEVFQIQHATQYFLIVLSILIILLLALLIRFFILSRERKLADEATKKCEMRLAHFFHATFEVIFIHEQGRVLDVNPAIVDVLGYQPDEVIGKNLIEYIEPESQRLLSFSPDGDCNKSSEINVINKGGDVVPAEVRAKTLELGGRAVDILGLRIITEHKQIEKALRESERRLRSVVTSAPIVLWALDKRGTFTLSEGQGLKALGLKPGEIVGSSVFDIFRDVPELLEDCKRALGGDSFVNERVIAERVYEMHFSPILTENGGLIGTIGVASDITARKKAEKALRKAHGELEMRVQKRTAELLKASRAYKVLSDCSGVLVRASGEREFLHEVCRIIVEEGKYRMAWVGMAEQNKAKTVRPVSQAGFEYGYLEKVRFSWGDNELGRGPTGTAIRTGKPVINKDVLTNPNYSAWRSAAIERGYESSISLPLIGRDRVLGALNIYASEPDAFTHDEIDLLMDLASDISFGIVALRTRAERKLAEQQVYDLLQQNRSLTQRLFEAQETERRHVARELHDEFGQWLTAVQLHAQGITELSQDKTSKIFSSAKKISHSAAEMHKAIRGIVHQLRPQALDDLGLSEGLRELVTQWRAHHQNTDCRLTIQGDIDNLDEPIKITLYRIVQESLTNVAKYARAGHVKIQLKYEPPMPEVPEFLVLTIEDDGQGMDCSVSSKGMGLAGMRERVLAVGGEFAMNSHPGMGVRIEVRIPVNSKGNL